MSFDVFAQLVDKYYDHGFPRSVVIDAFGEAIGSNLGAGVHRLSFPYRRGGEILYGGGDLYLDDEDRINGFAVMAAGGTGLYDALYQVMQRVSGLYLYWPGGYVVADPATIPLLPHGIEKELGAPAVVHSGREIVEAIENGP